MPRPLAGRAVVVTRTGPRAADLVGTLRKAGATVVELPLTEQTEAADSGVALRAAAADIDAYTWVVLTSVNAVERLLHAIGDSAALAATRVAAVGPASADALRVSGVQPALVPRVHSAAGLVEAFEHATPGENGRILFPAADRAPDTIVDGLTAKGWTVDRVDAYRTVALAPPNPDRYEQVADADAIVFLAASAVQAYVAGAPASAGAVPAPALVVCIGGTTASAARQAGLSGVRQASAATADGLVAALVEHLGEAAGDAS